MKRRSLAVLSDTKLLSNLRELVKKEKQTTLAILLHLGEVDRRELYLEYGFSSLYDYCVGALKYSRSSAGRRIATARCVRRFPEIYDLLDSGDVNLTAIGLVAPILDEENKDLILAEIRDKTQHQIEMLVAGYRPPVAYRDRVKPVRVAVPNLGQNAKKRCNLLIFNSHSGSNSASATGGVALARGEPTARRAATKSPNRHEAPADAGTTEATTAQAMTPDGPAMPRNSRVEKRLLVQFLAGEEFMAKFDEVKSLLSNKMPLGTFEDVFEALIDEFLERHSPAKKHQRREARTSRKKGAVRSKKQRAEKRGSKPLWAITSNKLTGAVSNKLSGKGSTSQRRKIPATVRDNVHVRDGGRCAFVGKNGKRCGSKRNLQIDHIKPVARGGTNSLSNLRLLCGKHNRLEAKRVLGAGVMDGHTRKE